MGGRGGNGGSVSAGPKTSKDGTIIYGKETHIETTYIEGRGFTRARYKSEVLEATTDGEGNVTFQYAKPTSNEKLHKTNKTHYISYDVVAGAQDGQTFGINWSKVKSVSGQTYSIKDEAKAAGLKWDPGMKRWTRR